MLINNNNLFEVLVPYKQIKLFFDLETSTKDNNETNILEIGNEKLKQTINFIRIMVNKYLNINISNEDFIILNSCS